MHDLLLEQDPRVQEYVESRKVAYLRKKIEYIVQRCHPELSELVSESIYATNHPDDMLVILVYICSFTDDDLRRFLQVFPRRKK